jgi:hypothetical protein
MGAQMYAWPGSCCGGDANMCGGNAGCDGNALCACAIGRVSTKLDSRSRLNPTLLAMMAISSADRMKPCVNEAY